ncbi:hypothetical protein B0H14DRAFT_3455123 [Mycena olivaceomarginata]|nr:hypothetical protein B0H14DRAFT_3455123 [Mycena olivaceomarginata]
MSFAQPFSTSRTTHLCERDADYSSVHQIRDGARRSQTRHGARTANFLLRSSSFLWFVDVSALSPTNEPAATGFRRDRYRSSFTSFTGEAVKGGDAFNWPVGSPLRRPAVAWCIRLPRESKYASAGRSRASYAESAHARCGHLAAATVASLFPLRDEDEMVDASCTGTLSATSMWR